MDDLRPINHKKFNEFMKDKEFKGRKDYALRDLNAKFGFKPLVEESVSGFFEGHEKHQI